MILVPIFLLIGALLSIAVRRKKTCRACPYCAERIRADAQICCYCGQEGTSDLTDHVSRI